MRSARSALRHWKLKAVVQKAIGLAPASHRWNYAFQRYVTRSARLDGVWVNHKIDQTSCHLRSWRQYRGAVGPTTVLELGTGWFPVVPICLSLTGADRVETVDRLSLLRPDNLAVTVTELADRLRRGELEQRLGSIRSDRADALIALSGRERLHPAELPKLGVWPLSADARHLSRAGASVDLFVSNNTLEHIERAVLLDILREYRRLADPQAVMSHFVDMSDHYSHFDHTLHPLHFLRFDERQWRWWNNRVVPQNRLRLPDYRRLLRAAGFELLNESPWVLEGSLEGVPIHDSFAMLSPADLAVTHVWLVARPASCLSSGPAAGASSG